MPELPEVEVVRRGLVERITGRRIVAAAVHHPRPVRRHLAGADDFVAATTGRRFTEPRRRGKFLWLPFDDGDAVLAHLGMSGQFRVDDEAARARAGLGPAEHRHVRVTWELDDGTVLRFCDQRMFGGLTLSYGGADLPPEIAHIAPDPFEPAYDQAVVVGRIRRRRTAIKRALLDQGLVSGIGNIYADEALWRARLHWARATETLPPTRIREVLSAAAAVMTEALAVGGTSFDPLYVNVNGESGYFSRGLDAYGRTDQPCHRCGTPIVRDVFTNRSSFRCPRCQRTPAAVHRRA